MINCLLAKLCLGHFPGCKLLRSDPLFSKPNAEEPLLAIAERFVLQAQLLCNFMS